MGGGGFGVGGGGGGRPARMEQVGGGVQGLGILPQRQSPLHFLVTSYSRSMNPFPSPMPLARPAIPPPPALRPWLSAGALSLPPGWADL